MKPLLTLVSVLCLAIPAVASAGNTEPALYLEAYSSEDIPTSPAPSYICTHGEQSGGMFHCYAAKAPRSSLYLVVHVDKLDATCPYDPGTACDSYGGFLGLPFGIANSGDPVVFTCVFPCPGFGVGPSLAGWPAAIIVSSLGEGCRDRWDNPCYLGFFNNSDGTGATQFDIVGNADEEAMSGPNHSRDVINCSFEYDAGTVVGCNAQWGGEQTTPCLALVPVQATTWGAMKQMFR